jgi:hypothetical protein
MAEMTTPKELPDEFARILHAEMKLVREELRTELREQARTHRRRARLYAGSAVAGFYGGAALVAFLVLALALGLPSWASALIVAAVLIAVAVLLRQAARSGPGGREQRDFGDGGSGGGTAPATVGPEMFLPGATPAAPPAPGVPSVPSVPPRPAAPPAAGGTP